MPLLPAKYGASLGLLAGTATGSYLLWDRFVPTSIEDLLVRKGYVIAESDNSFKAIYLENKDSLKDIDVSSDHADIGAGASRIREWCQKNLPKTWSKETDDILNKASKFCVINPSTARFFLVNQGNDSIIDDLTEEDGKVSLAVFKGEKDFDLAIRDYSLDTGIAFRNWCKDELDKKLEDLKVGMDVLSKYCSPLGYRTIGERLQKEGREQVSENRDWSVLFGKNKWNPLFISILENNQILDIADDIKGGFKLMDWCNIMWVTSIYEEGILGGQYPWISSVCSREKLIGEI